MKLFQLLNKESLISNINASEKNQVIEELLSCCDLSSEQVSKEDIYTALLAREDEQSTGIGDGIAFPHARLTGLNRVHIVLGFSQKGIEFNSLDKKPVHITVLMLVDRSKPNELLKIRAAIAKLLAQKDISSAMLNANSKDKLHEIIKGSEIAVDYDITAKDIMRPSIASISCEMSIRDAAHKLHKHHIDSLPVIDKDNYFHGELSCHDLFSYGLPDFFNNLHVISFVKHINPFEKYFNVDKSLKVSNILEKKSKKHLIISSEATLMEIVFEMTVKNKECLYILSKDGKLKGVLDRYSIIDKIIIGRHS